MKTRRKSISSPSTSTSLPEKEKDKPKFRVFKSLYQPRPSPLDFETLMQQKHPMRGFFVLFWVACGYRMIITMYQHYKNTGTLFSSNLVDLMGKDAMSLIFSDLIQIFSLFYVLIYQWLITWKIVPLRIATVLQHLFQCIWFCGIIGWAIVNPENWGWSSTATFTLHAMSNLMKQHSYTSYNIALQYKLRRMNELSDREKKGDSILQQEEQEEYHHLKDELSRGGEMFPKNQTVRNFCDYLVVPSLVYELGYPRTPRFRLWYFMERVLSTFFTITLLYFIVDHQVTRKFFNLHFIAVLLQMPQQTFIDSVADLLLPFMSIWILTFFLIFEVHKRLTLVHL
jgi:sterol O-acyltransferase